MKNLTLLLAVFVLCIISCKKDPVVNNNEPKITRFTFTKAANPTLKEDVEGTISGNEITVTLHSVEKTALKANITTDATTLDYHGELKDFTQPVTISLQNGAGKQMVYTVKATFRDVYFTSYEYNQTRSIAVYWKNGNKVILTDPSNLNLAESGSAIYVTGNDIYVAGASKNIDENLVTAVYWKNGVKTELTTGETNTHSEAIARAIKVVGSDVYVIGSIFYPGNSKYGLNVYFTVYWKNGVVTKLTDGSLNSNVTSLAIHNNDIYVSGFVQNPSMNAYYRAVYWKNGNKVELSNGTTDAVARAIAVVNNDVHLVGIEDGNAVHWKNGVKQVLGRGNGYAIQVEGNDVHIGGSNEFFAATYWKNGNKIKTFSIRGFNLSVFEKDVYMFGFTAAQGTQKFIFYLNDQQKPIEIINIDHIEGEDNPHAVFIKNQ